MWNAVKPFHVDKIGEQLPYITKGRRSIFFMVRQNCFFNFVKNEDLTPLFSFKDEDLTPLFSQK